MIEHLRKLRADLAPMTWGQRLEHLWAYYKWAAAGAVGAVLLVYVVISCLICANTQVLLAGMSLNVPVTDPLQSCLTQELFQQLGGQPGQKVSFSGDTLDTGNLAFGTDAAYSTMSKLSGLIQGGALDYLILDDKALEQYDRGEVFLDLTRLFSQQELASMPVKDLAGEPKLLELSGTWFGKNYLETGTHYLVFIGSTSRLPACRELWHYLLTGKVHP